jgi:cytochrome c553
MARRSVRWAALALCTLALAACAHGAFAQEAGPSNLMVCAGCHNPEPGTLPSSEAQRIPRLGGQQPEYLRSALEAYRTRQRDHFYMRGMAAGLRGAELDAAIRFLADPEAAPPARSEEAAKPPPDAAMRCVACHGSHTHPPATADAPRLAGQHAPYLEAAFLAYANQTRRHDVMSSQARGPNGEPTLTASELRHVADWFSAQRGLVPR